MRASNHVKPGEEKQVTLEYRAESLEKAKDTKDDLFSGRRPNAYKFMTSNWIPSSMAR